MHKNNALLLLYLCVSSLFPAVFCNAISCIFRSWLRREERRGLKPGQMLYLISMDWWKSWNDFVDCKVSVNESVCLSFGSYSGLNLPWVHSRSIPNENPVYRSLLFSSQLSKNFMFNFYLLWWLIVTREFSSWAWGHGFNFWACHLYFNRGAKQGRSCTMLSVYHIEHQVIKSNQEHLTAMFLNVPLFLRPVNWL